MHVWIENSTKTLMTSIVMVQLIFLDHDASLIFVLLSENIQPKCTFFSGDTRTLDAYQLAGSVMKT